MDLKEVMEQKVFVVAGDTLQEDKYACKIKRAMEQYGYRVYGVGEELKSLNDVPEEIDILDLCIQSKKGLALLQECRRSFQGIVIQPGAESDELLAFLLEKKLPYLESCLLRGLRQYHGADV